MCTRYKGRGGGTALCAQGIKGGGGGHCIMCTRYKGRRGGALHYVHKV